MSVDKCHEMHSVDLAWLRRKKLITPGNWTSLSWSRGGRETGSIRLAIHKDGIALVYRHRRQGDEWADVHEFVPLIRSSTRFDGFRQWFKCLACGSRCRILYGGARFRCRRCNGLKYETQYEPPFARSASAALKIRERLGCKGGLDEPFPAKPKGMHWKTYERLRSQEERMQDSWAIGIAKRFRMFEQGD